MKIKTVILWRLLTFLTCIILIPFLFVKCGRQHPRSYEKHFDKEGWIGVYVQELDRELRNYLDIDERYGVLINDVIADSPAEAAGLRDEDVIIKFDDKRIRKTTDLTRAVKRKRQRCDRCLIDLIDMDAEISSVLEKVSVELEKEMERMNEELEHLNVEIKIFDQ